MGVDSEGVDSQKRVVLEKGEADMDLEPSILKVGSDEVGAVTSDVRQNCGLLLVSVQPQGKNREMGLETDDDVWFGKALGELVDSVNFKVANVFEDGLPDTVEEKGIIISGSVHSAYEEHHWIRDVENFIREMWRRKKKIFGVCFGHQLIAQSFGGEVRRNSRGLEFGRKMINLKEEGKKNLLFEGVKSPFPAYETHGDVVDRLSELCPPQVLAFNDMSDYQALSYDDGLGRTTHSVQFHPEMTREICKKFADSVGVDLENEGRSLDTPDARKVLHNFVNYFVLRSESVK